MLLEKDKSNIIHEIEQILGLIFLENSASGNLCYVGNNGDLQDDFRQFFTERDLFYFAKSFNQSEIKIPEDRIQFWKLVKKGKEND